METTIIGRVKKIAQMENAFSSKKPELVAMIGRRRVGKTYLIRNTFKNRIDFEITGLQYGNTKSQLQNFVIQMQHHFPHFQFKIPVDWMEAFHILSKALSKIKKKTKKVIFIDELPWLATKKSDFISGFSWFWNSWATKQNIMVIICGSAASWMINKIINDKGNLHNRVTDLIALQPFTLKETEEFLKYKNVKLNHYQIIQLYMSIGGIPMYLDFVKSGLSAIQNIQTICFEQEGFLRDEFNRLFPALFSNHHRHLEIVKLLASKNMGMTRKEIVDKTSLKNGGMLTDILEELDKCGFIDIYHNFGKIKRQSLYRLTDPYLLFYLKFIEPIGKKTITDFTKLSDLPNYKAWSGYAFENICLKHIDQIKNALKIGGIYTVASSFYAKPKDGLSGAQIDLVIDRNDQSINICEIKFSITDYSLTKKDVQNIENKKKIFYHNTKTKKHLFTTLITTTGAIENSNKLNYIDSVITAAQLFD